MMRYLPTILLGVCALVLSALAIVNTDGKYYDAIWGTPAIEPGNQLFKVKELDQVRSITLENYEGEQTELKLAGNIWVGTTPWKDRADRLFIDALFQFTAGLQVQEVIPRKDLDLKNFGLRNGHTRVTMRDAKGKAVCDYRIGRPAGWQIPTEDGKSTLPTSFIRLADQDLKHNIYLCSSAPVNIHSLFNDNFARFRDHHPFYFSPQYLDKARIQNNEGEVVISRESLRSLWMITKPLNLNVDPKSLSELLTNLARLNAFKVEDRANVTLPTAANNVSGAMEIALHNAGAEEDFTLQVYPPSKEGDSVVLATVSNRPDTVFHLPLTSTDANSISMSQFQTGVNDLRSKTMTQINAPQLKNIIIKPTDRPLTFLSRTKKTTWRVQRNKGYEVANEIAVIDLLTAVTRDKVQKFVTDAATDLAPYGLDRPEIRLAFNFFNHQKGLVISIGRDPKGEKVYAHIMGKSNIWEISQETLAKISIHPWQWRTSHVWHIPKVDIKHIDIQRKGKPAIGLEYAFFTEKWTATRSSEDQTTNVTAGLNPHRATTLLTHLESLHTTKWLGPAHNQAQQALKTPDTIISIQIQQVNDDGSDGEPITKTLKIAHTPGNFIFFGKVETLPADSASDGEDSYFLIDPETIQRLYVNLFK